MKLNRIYDDIMGINDVHIVTVGENPIDSFDINKDEYNVFINIDDKYQLEDLVKMIALKNIAILAKLKSRELFDDFL